MSNADAGGFLPSGILSPPFSTHSSSTIGSTALPHPRSSPLKTGGPKESSFIRFVDQGIQNIQRRFANRGDDELGERTDPDVKGYVGFAEVEADMKRIIDLIWISGTPSLQIPYLLQLAMLAKQYIVSLPPSPKATFRLLDKLDLAFASLLQGRNIDTGETLPGFSSGRGVSGTQKVRIKSIVDQTRIVVAEVLGAAEELEDEDDLSDDIIETGDEMDTDDDMNDINEAADATGYLEMGIAKVYDRVIVELGDTLGGPPIGIITDD